MFKPLFEKDGYKPVDKKRETPTHDSRHPKDSSFVTGVQGQFKIRRKSIAGLRDTMALASKRPRLINMNEGLDARLDRPAPAPIGTHTPIRRKLTMKAVAPCRRG